MINIGVMVSGSGSNLQAIIDSVDKGEIKGRVAVVISDKKDAFAIDRAKSHNIPSCYIKKDPDYTLRIFKDHKVDLIVLAGYLSIVEKKIVDAYPNRIINIHPSLIPKFCGKGFYGLRVHEAVVAAGEKTSGATVHFVDSGIDTGPIILQKKVGVQENDTPETLQKKVLELEHRLLPDAINIVIERLEGEQ